MDRCDECGVNPAQVHITQVSNGETTVINLCSACAAKKGVAISIDDEMLQNMTAKKSAVRCRECGTTGERFKSNGRLGCAACYSVFEQPVDEMLMHMHGASVHAGKRYEGTGAPAPAVADEVQRLQGELEDAVRAEAFERAIELRNALQTLHRRKGASEDHG